MILDTDRPELYEYNIGANVWKPITFLDPDTEAPHIRVHYTGGVGRCGGTMDIRKRRKDMIDCSKPEDYQVSTLRGWCEVVNLVDTGERDNVRYGVTFKCATTLNGHDHIWAASDQLRRKPKWEPEVGKVYLFSDEGVGDKAPSMSTLVDINPTNSLEKYCSADRCWWADCFPIEDSPLYKDRGE